MSQAGIISTASGPAFVETIEGDVGSVSGTTLQFYANHGSANAGSSVNFVAASATEMDLKTTDVYLNTLIGQFAGNSSIATPAGVNVSLGYLSLNALTTGVHNVAIGGVALSKMTTGNENIALGTQNLKNNVSGSFNTAVGGFSLVNATTSNNTALGYQALSNVTSGDLNVAVGVAAGTGYHSTEASNICINNFGTLGDSNTIRIGTQGSSSGKQNKCFVAGIVGNTVSNPQFVTINSVTGQLGVGSIAAITWNVVTSASNPVTLVAQNGYIAKGAGVVDFILPASSAIGDTFKIIGYGNLWTIAQNAGQSITIGFSTSTVGVTGSVSASMVSDNLELTTVTTNLEFYETGIQGNLLIV